MNLNNYLDNLLEGGNAMQGSRINVENIKATFDKYRINVIKKIDPQAKYKTIGSLGKKPSSGDIDIAISTDLDLQTVSDKLKELNIEHKINRGLKQIYTKYPIYDRHGNDTGDRVQIDLMFGDVDLLYSTYWAAGEKQSKYTGSDISIFFAAMTRFTVIKKMKKENELELQKLKIEHPDLKLSYVYDINNGIYIKARWLEELKSGKNKGQMKEVPLRLSKIEAKTTQEILDIWNSDSKIKWTMKDFSLPLEKVWKKAKEAFTSDKLKNIMDYINPSLDTRPQLESMNTFFLELMNEFF